MNLIIYQMVELEHIHVSYCYRIIKPFAGSAVTETEFTCSRISAFVEKLYNVFLSSTVEYRGGNVPSLLLCGKTKVNFQYLSYIHSGRYAQRVKHYLERLTVFQERHILFRKNSGNNTLVAMASCHLISNVDLSLSCDVASYQLVYSRRKLVAVFS